MTSIKKLPIALCNQISAGEVVERPANIIKELVENSIDAKADSIHIELEHGGLASIILRDNGIGIPSHELSLALERYTTSKIERFEDMYSLHTFGFRGEALASIASVSELKLISSHLDNGTRKESHYVQSSYGAIVKEGIHAPVEGTHIHIENLFLNTPPRLRFLKSAHVEQKRCVDIFLRIALVYLDKEFSLSVGGKKLYTFSKNQSILERLQHIFPNELTDSLLIIDSHYNGIALRGVCSAPNIIQKKSDRMLCYVNNRIVSDKILIKAIKEGYKEYLTTKEYPLGVFFLDIPADEVDVNVHPTKSEVRFVNESACIRTVIRAIKEALIPYREDASQKTSQEEHFPKEDTPIWNEYIHERIIQYKENHLENNSTSTKPQYIQEEDTSPYQYSQTIEYTSYVQSKQSPPYEEEIATTTNTLPQKPLILSDSLPLKNIYEYDVDTLDIFGNTIQHSITPNIQKTYTFLCSLYTTYLVYKNIDNDSLLIIDQHAAHERILEEYITRNVKNNVQYLSIPITMVLHQSEEERLHELWAELLELGFIIKKENSSITVTAIPSYIPTSKVVVYFKEMLLDIDDDSTRSIHKKACTNAIKKGDILTAEDAYSLLAQWQQIPNNTHCPHGRPICVTLNTATLEQLFKRTV